MNKIIYLDAAASALKPESVILSEESFLRDMYANAGRGICARAMAVDEMVAATRRAVAEFMNAASDNIVFTSGATDGLNRVCHIIGGAPNLHVGVSALDHHSARLPWVAAGCKITECPLDASMNIDVHAIPNVDVLVITAMSNVIGRAQDVAAIVRAARAKNPNVITVVDAAQYVAHDKIDVIDWDADFVCWSAHKIGADTGLGIMYIKNPNRFRPDKFGGGMVNRVNADGTFTIQPAPDCWEAGTLPLTQIAGLAAAIENISLHRPDMELIKYMYDALSKNPRIKILTSRDAAILSFVISDMHVLDFGALVGARGLCLRVGNMCATWIHNYLGITGCARLSVGPYNTMSDAAGAVDIINSVVK